MRIGRNAERQNRREIVKLKTPLEKDYVRWVPERRALRFSGVAEKGAFEEGVTHRIAVELSLGEVMLLAEAACSELRSRVQEALHLQKKLETRPLPKRATRGH
jgi:hypothetical protein